MSEPRWPASSEFAALRRYGPTLAERVQSSPRLRERQRLGRAVYGALGQVRFHDLDRLPTHGPVILAVNHRSFLDGALLFGRLQRVVSFLVKAEAFGPAGGRLGRLLLQAGQIPVRRGQLDPAPVRLALQILEAGGVVGLFPEGTRGNGLVATARPGVGYLAVRTGAPVLPVAIHGSHALGHRRSVRRPAVDVHLGAPVVLAAAPPDRPLNRRLWLTATEDVRLRLADLVAATQPVPAAGPLPRPSRSKVSS